MRLYLSSFRVGNHIDQLATLTDGRRMAIIENALDFIPDEKRRANRANLYNIYDIFSDLGYAPEPFDLRNFFAENGNGEDKIEAALRSFDIVWVLGGNTFLLRRAMRQSGMDILLSKLLLEDAFVYGGWSAGASVLGPTLHGIELCDDPNELAEGYDPTVIWEGLNITPWSIAPHYKSDHPETLLIDKSLAYMEKHAIPAKPIRDGDVILHNETGFTHLKAEDGKFAPLNANKS